MENRTKLLLGILAFLGIFAAWTWIGPGGDRRGDGAETAPVGRVPAAGRAAAKAPVEQVEELRLAALTAASGSRAIGRNPWSFGLPPEPAPRAITSVIDSHPGPRPQPPVAPVPAPAVAGPPVFPWRYLGSFGPRDRRIATFAEGDTVHNRREGEVLADRFVLEHIGIESVDVRPLGFPGAPAQRVVPGGAGSGRGVS